MSSNKLQHSLFMLNFIICCLVFLTTCISMTTENWVTVKPYRSFQTTDPKILKQQIIQSFNNSFQNSTFNNDFDFSFIDDVIEEEQIIDLISKIDCKRFQGFIRLGLFKGTWLLNYGFGCKYRLNRASSNFFYSVNKINFLFLNILV